MLVNKDLSIESLAATLNWFIGMFGCIQWMFMFITALGLTMVNLITILI